MTCANGLIRRRYGEPYQVVSLRGRTNRRHQKQKIPLQSDVDSVIQEFNDRRDRAMSNFIVSVFCQR
jgi:hypothetical protein